MTEQSVTPQMQADVGVVTCRRGGSAWSLARVHHSRAPEEVTGRTRGRKAALWTGLTSAPIKGVPATFSDEIGLFVHRDHDL